MAEQGIVKWYSLAKGYGFVVRESTGEEVFVHHSALGAAEEPLVEGEKVSFEVVESPKGLRGQNVSRQAEA